MDARPSPQPQCSCPHLAFQGNPIYADLYSKTDKFTYRKASSLYKGVLDDTHLNFDPASKNLHRWGALQCGGRYIYSHWSTYRRHIGNVKEMSICTVYMAVIIKDVHKVWKYRYYYLSLRWKMSLTTLFIFFYVSRFYEHPADHKHSKQE